MARDPSRQKLIDKVLGDPDLYPDTFKGFIPKTLVDNALFRVSRFQVDSVGGEDWHSVGVAGEPAFENSWVNFGGLYLPAGFYRDYLDIVHLRGLVKNGTVGPAIFTLPPGYRPEATVHVGIDSNSAHGALEVTAAGIVKCTIGNTAWVQLDNIHFRAFT